jgi:GntR family transcriptional regulator, arabinose operon transcriptional repressor
MSSSQKKHEAIYERLRKEILEEQWPVGTKLPREAEIAKRFGCSIGTLSKAVGLLVHEGLVERRPRAGTQILRTSPQPQETGAGLDAYAFICSSEQHEGIRRTAYGFQEAAHANHRRSIILSTGSDYRKEAKVLAKLTEFDIKGAVVHPVLVTPDDYANFVQLVEAARFPIVLTLSLPGLKCPSVVVDGMDMGLTMTNYLIQKGAKKIGFLSNYMMTSFMRDRYRGYQWALRMAGIAEDSRLVITEPSMTPNFENPLEEPTRLAETYLKSVGKLDAIVCGYDYIALGCLAAAKKLGLRVPEDILITGADDISLAASAEVPLTTYRINSEERGRLLFKVLDSYTKGEIGSPSETLFRGEIVVRRSA